MFPLSIVYYTSIKKKKIEKNSIVPLNNIRSRKRTVYRSKYTSQRWMLVQRTNTRPTNGIKANVNNRGLITGGKARKLESREDERGTGRLKGKPIFDKIRVI